MNLIALKAMPNNHFFLTHLNNEPLNIVSLLSFQFAAILLLVFVTECVVVVLGYIYRAKVNTVSLDFMSISQVKLNESGSKFAAVGLMFLNLKFCNYV